LVPATHSGSPPAGWRCAPAAVRLAWPESPEGEPVTTRPRSRAALNPLTQSQL